MKPMCDCSQGRLPCTCRPVDEVVPTSHKREYPNIENITLFTDASYSDQTNMGGAGFWAKGGTTGNVKLEGSFPIMDAASSHHAEFLASMRAIDLLLEDPAFNELLSSGIGCRLVLVTDCQGTKQLLESGKGKLLAHPDSPCRIAYDRFKSIQHNLGFQLKVNWVKAHNSDGSPRTWVNNLCDKYAGKARRALEASHARS